MWRYECFQYAFSRLNTPLDFANNDAIEVHRSKVPWPKTIKELNKVKFDWLNLKLSSKNDKEIK